MTWPIKKRRLRKLAADPTKPDSCNLQWLASITGADDGIACDPAVDYQRIGAPRINPAALLRCGVSCDDAIGKRSAGRIRPPEIDPATVIVVGAAGAIAVPQAALPARKSGQRLTVGFPAAGINIETVFALRGSSKALEMLAANCPAKAGTASWTR